MLKQFISKILLLVAFIILSLAVSSCSNSSEANNSYKLQLSGDYPSLPDYVSNSKFKSKIVLDNKEIKLNNDVFVDKENKDIFAELEDVCDKFEINLTYDPELDFQVKLEKYEFIFEINLYDYSKAIKRMPAIFVNSYHDTYIKDGKIYVYLNEILEFFHYDVSYDEIDDKIIIKNNDNRKEKTWEDTYSNIINSYFKESNNSIRYNFRYSEHLKNYLKLDELPKYKFVLHDFNKDSMPELLLYYQNQENNENRGSSGWIMYKYNESSKIIEKFEPKESNIFSYVFGYDMENRLYTITYSGENPLTQCYEWNNNSNSFELIDRKDGVIDDKIIRFDGIDKNYIDKNNSTVKSTVASDIAEETLKSNLKVYFDNSEIYFNENVPIQKKSAILLPVNEIFEKLGYKISWLENGKPIELKVGKSNAGLLLTKDERTIFIPQFGYGDTLTVNKSIEITPEIPPQNLNGSSYLSIAAISEATGLNINWDKENNRIDIKK